MIIRNLKQSLHIAFQDSPVVLLNGARQVGKSTLAKQLLAEHPIRYLTLDDNNIRAAAMLDPQGFIHNSTGLWVIDEIQRAPELMLAIKASIDQNREPGRFLLTGSANVLMLPHVSDSLAGRIEIHNLWPLSQGELIAQQEKFIDFIFSNEAVPIGLEFKVDKLALNATLVQGGYPEILQRQSQERRNAWFKSYITTVTHREIRDLTNIEGIAELPRLLHLLAARTGSLLNYAELSRTAGLPQTTLKRYLALFEMIFLYHPLPAWAQNFSKRLVKSPKIFLNDTGLTAYLLGINEQRLSADRNIVGKLLESFVFTELKKQAGWSKTQPYFFHYRAHSGQEIDFILEEPGGRLVGIEVKAASTVSGSDFKNLQQFADDTGEKFYRGVVFYTGERVIPFGKNLFAIPISALWELN